MDIEKTNIMEIIKINGIEYKKSPNGVFLIRKEEKTDPKKQGDIYVKKEMFDQLKKGTSKIPLKLLNELLVTMKKGCLCALCGAIPTPIMNILKYFGDEIKNDIVKDN